MQKKVQPHRMVCGEYLQEKSHPYRGNALPAVCPQCKVWYVGKYSNPSFGPFSQVCCSITGFSKLLVHLGCAIFYLSPPRRQG